VTRRTECGRLDSYIVVHQTLFPAWTEDVPYNVAQVALEEDGSVILTGNAVACGNEDLKVDMALEGVFDGVAEDVTVPRWRSRG
jgi:hypothetical protein